jgi:uncharacterized membrane protein
MWEQLLKEVLRNHRGKFFGVVGGLVFAILVIVIGFLQTVFIACCSLIGYIIGKRIDESENLREVIERIFKERYDRF